MLAMFTSSFLIENYKGHLDYSVNFLNYLNICLFN